MNHKNQNSTHSTFSGSCNKESVCARLNCHAHATCGGSGGHRKCTCSTCPPVYKPVCGNNNETYNSECELYRTACETADSELELEHHGVCTLRPCTPDTCAGTPYATCGPEVTCHCPTCRHVFEPVCGDNGVLYDNLCLLQRAACLRKVTIKRQPLPFCGEYLLLVYKLCLSLSLSKRRNFYGISEIFNSILQVNLCPAEF